MPPSSAKPHPTKSLASLPITQGPRESEATRLTTLATSELSSTLLGATASHVGEVTARQLGYARSVTYSEYVLPVCELDEEVNTMSWKTFHHRGETLRDVEHVANERRDGALPMSVPGVAENFTDELDLVGALVLRWHARLSGNIERAMAGEPLDLEAAVAARLAHHRGAASRRADDHRPLHRGARHSRDGARDEPRARSGDGVPRHRRRPVQRTQLRFDPGRSPRGAAGQDRARRTAGPGSATVRPRPTPSPTPPPPPSPTRRQSRWPTGSGRSSPPDPD